MSFSQPNSRDQLMEQFTDPRPTGIPVARYATYKEAQKAIDYLSDEKFPVEHTTIVGRDLMKVEKITGRLTTLRALVMGTASGAYMGMFIGLILALVNAQANFLLAVLTGVLLGSIAGAIFGVFGYLMTQGRRDFTSASLLVAGVYEVLCESQHAADARNHLAKLALAGKVQPLQQETPSAD